MEQFSKLAQTKRSRAREIKALNCQVTELEQQLDKAYGELTIKNKTLKEIVKQNEILYRELKENQNLVRNLKQQLEDEREFYLKQYAYHQAKLDGIQAQSSSVGLLSKEELTAQAEKLTKAELSRVLIDDQQEKLFLHRKIQKMENALAASTGTIYNLCVKFLRMKYLRDTLQEKLCEETEEHHMHVKGMNSLIEDLRNELENSVQLYHKNCKGECSQSNAMYLRVVTMNTRYMYENTVLQHEVRRLQHLIKDLALMQSKQFEVSLEYPMENHCEFQDEVNSVDTSYSKPTEYSMGVESNKNPLAVGNKLNFL